MKKSSRVTTGVGLLALLFLPLFSYAEGTSCGFPTVIVPEGRIMESTIPNGTTFWFLFDTQSGLSHSIEIKDPLEAWNNAFLGTLVVFPTGSCTGADPSGSTVNITPEIPSSGRRVSLTSTATRQWFTFTNNTGATRPYTISVTETTQFSPRWSTFGGFFTSWGFQNTTNATINGNLRGITGAGTEVANATFAIPSGVVVFRDTRSTDLNLAPDQAGSVIFTHDGPPGAVRVDGFMLTVAADIVVPVQFGPRRGRD